MVACMGGVIPRTDSRLLPDNMAEAAVNCDLSSGKLKGVLAPTLHIDLSSTPFPVKRAYRLPGPNPGDADAWLPLPSEFSSVVRSPLANDTSRRVYWTNPGDPTPYFNTYNNILDNLPPFALGIPQPSGASPNVNPVGGTTDGSVPLEDRSYCYTFVNVFGEESAPSLPSVIASGPADADWQVTGFPLVAPTNPAGVNYPPVVELRIYRTLTGATTGAQFFMAAPLAFPIADPTYHEAPLDDVFMANQPILESAAQTQTFAGQDSTTWANPPAGLDGLIALPGGMLAGFTGNTVHFCEPNRPHAWPPAYDQGVHFDIVGLAVWQSQLVVMTPASRQWVAAIPQRITYSTLCACQSRASPAAQLLLTSCQFFMHLKMA